MQKPEEYQPCPITHIVASVVLLLALLPFPYAYYTLLRIVVTICAGIIAYNLKPHEDRKNWFFIFVGIAILFNPIIPIHLSRKIWGLIDIIVAVVFGWHYWKNQKE